MKWYIPYNDIMQKTQQGTLDICVDDARVWSEPMEEFGLNCHVERPLCAKLTLIPVRPEVGGASASITGVVVRGTLTGRVVQACDLCAEDAPVDINHAFETFETVPALDAFSTPAAQSTDFAEERFAGDHFAGDHFAGDHFAGEDDDSESHFVYQGSALVLDVAALCWEELMLALPMRPLCAHTCKGLCTHCGTNLNSGICACKEEAGDPRLAALRALKIQS